MRATRDTKKEKKKRKKISIINFFLGFNSTYYIPDTDAPCPNWIATTMVYSTDKFHQIADTAVHPTSNLSLDDARACVLSY